MAQVLFFGASVTQGVGDSDGGWVDRIKRDLHSNMYSGVEQVGERGSIFNLGVAGNTVEDLIKRFSDEVTARKWRDRDLVIVISIGLNDSKARDEPKNYLFTTEQYRHNLIELIKIAKQYSDKILFVGLNPVNEKMLQPKDHSYFTQDRVRQFDQVMSEVARLFAAEKVEIFEEFLNMDWPKMLFDGLHPNSLGHEWIAEKVKPKLLKMMAL